MGLKKELNLESIDSILSLLDFLKNEGDTCKEKFLQCIKADNYSALETDYYKTINTLREVTQAFLRRQREAAAHLLEKKPAFAPLITVAEQRAKEIIYEEIHSVQQDSMHEFSTADNPKKIVGTHNLNGCAGFCITGEKTEKDGQQKNKIANIGHHSSLIYQSLKKAKNKLTKKGCSNIQICLIGGDLSSMGEYLPLLYNPDFPEITAARLCLSDAFLSSAFFVELNEDNHTKVKYHTYEQDEILWKTIKDIEDSNSDSDSDSDSDYEINPEQGQKKRSASNLFQTTTAPHFFGSAPTWLEEIYKKDSNETLDHSVKKQKK